jgi:hypothetical protein
MINIPTLAGLLAGATMLATCQQGPTGSGLTVQAARAQLRDLIVDVRAATAHRYRVLDDLGRLGPIKIIPIPEASTFAGVYFTSSDPHGTFHVQLATSPDLMDWTWRVELADQASQPTIAAVSDGGYVLACRMRFTGPVPARAPMRLRPEGSRP